MKRLKLLATIVIILLVSVVLCYRYKTNIQHFLKYYPTVKIGDFKEVDYPTYNIGNGKNDVTGVILHHTAAEDIYSALHILSRKGTDVSAHVVIDTDGTRYILAKPTAITWHAGYSSLNGRERVNEFAIGIEFQGNTLEEPLTKEQVNSAIDYIIPLMKKYNIDIANIVTHAQIRDEWLQNHKDSDVPEKIDITETEYIRFITELENRLQNPK